MNKKLKYAGIAGIVTILFSSLANAIAILIYGMASIIYIWGYKIVGEKANNKLLKDVSLAVIVWVVGFLIFHFSNYFQNHPSFFTLYFIVLNGLLGTLFGMAILKLKKIFGNIAKITGVLGIVTGACYILMGMSILGINLGVDLNISLLKYGVWLSIPVYILEIIILFKAAKLERFK